VILVNAIRLILYPVSTLDGLFDSMKHQSIVGCTYVVNSLEAILGNYDCSYRRFVANRDTSESQSDDARLDPFTSLAIKEAQS
jgi:hypothetical protein